jgi:hypothetical protein
MNSCVLDYKTNKIKEYPIHKDESIHVLQMFKEKIYDTSPILAGIKRFFHQIQTYAIEYEIIFPGKEIKNNNDLLINIGMEISNNEL